jgi:hypothetical protein
MQTTADQDTAALPDGTDTVIAGASADTSATDTPSTEDRTVPATTRAQSRQSSGDAGESGIADRIRRGRENLSSQAGEKARGLVSQGLERSAEALGNVAKLVGDTAPGLEDRLGPDYGDYARRAAGAIENVANTIAEKDADELIDDTREFVRNSPGLALAGAAIVGFVVARLIKAGTTRTDDDEDDDY